MKTGYKQTEIGVIPEDWEVKRLGELFEITSSKRVFQSEWKKEGIPFYRARELAVLSRKGFVQNELFITREMYDEFEKIYGVPNIGDILVTGVGTLGKVYVVSDNQKFYFKDGNIIWFKISNEIIANFLKQLYLTPLIIKQIDDASEGTTVGTYTISGAKNTKIPFPPLPEQTAIAAALSDVDALMVELDKLIAKKRDIKQATMQQLLTGKKRLAGFSGEWEETKLEKFASFYKGKGLAKNEIDIYGKTPCVHYGELFTQYAESITETHSRTNLSGNVFLSKNNDVLMPTSDVTPNGLAKASCILKDDVILGGDILVIRTNLKEINGTFLSFVIRHSKEKIMQLVTGSTVYHLYASDMKNFIFLIPSIEEQTAIATILSDMDAEINALQQKREKTAQLKQGMMQELLTGRIRLIGGNA
jgi:type I restriction enzyme S subunit